jgi:hypothetical protein
MHPTHYDMIAADHRRDLDREVEAAHRMARASGVFRRPSIAARMRAALAGFSLRRWVSALGIDPNVARPGRDLGPPGRPELGEDVLDVATGGLRRDA